TKRLKPEDLELIVTVHEEREIGKLLRAIAERQFGAGLDHLRSLLASRQSEMLLLWSIGDLVRQALKSASAPGRDAGSYAGRGGWSRNPYSTWEIAPIAARKYSYQELVQALRHVRQADLAIKSSWKDSRVLLEFLIWQIVTGKVWGSLPIGEGILPQL